MSFPKKTKIQNRWKRDKCSLYCVYHRRHSTSIYRRRPRCGVVCCCDQRQHSSVMCRSCNKPGHTANRCFAKKNKKKIKKVPQPGVNPQPSASGSVPASRTRGDAADRHKKTPVADRIAKSSNIKWNASTFSGITAKYCYVHNTSTHSTDECTAWKTCDTGCN